MSQKLSTRALKKLILETVQEIKQESLNENRKRKPIGSKAFRNSARKAIALINEDADPAKVDSKRFPMKLSDAAAAAGEEAENLVTGGDNDGEKPDDVIGAGAGSASVKDLKPSQSSMNIEKAVAFAIAAIRQVTPFPSGAGGDLGAIITSDNHIMDGHHRWIASGMVDPTSEVGGFIVQFPAQQMIAALNMITVKLGITSGKPGSGGFDQFNEAGILTVLEKYAQEGVWSADGDPQKVVEACEKFTGKQSTEAVQAAAKKMADNVSQLTLSVPAGFPERPDMPVISKGKGHLALAIDLLKSGQVDINPPYDPKTETEEPSEQVADNYRAKGNVIVERWNKLAGILK